MGRSISQAYYERFNKWKIRQNKLQQQFKALYDLDYLGGSNMKGILTAPECRTDVVVDQWKKCSIRGADALFKALEAGTIVRADIIAWIKLVR